MRTAAFVVAPVDEVPPTVQGAVQAGRPFGVPAGWGGPPRLQATPSDTSSMNPKLMGVVNVTPDSFSDGGLYLDSEAAVAHGEKLVRDGADVLDVGGESTRPGAAEVEEAEELRRIEPVVAALASAATVSIDTSKLAVAKAALDAGASIVNDVTALRRDPEMAALCAERGAGVVLMHMPGNPRTMQDDPA